MRPQLIVDFSARTLCALVVTGDGQVVLLSQELHQVVTRTFPFELLLDPRPTDDPDFPWEEVLPPIAAAGARGFFARARRLGLTRTGERVAGVESVPLDSPLAVLSAPAALVDPVASPLLPGVALLLLEALLEPVFSSLAESGLASRGAVACAIVPATLGRHARLALHRVFRHRGFPHLTILPREVAAAMAMVGEPDADHLVWDATGHDLSLHRVRIEEVENGRRFHTAASRTAKGLGWPFWVLQAGLALAAQGHIPNPPGSLSTALDRALFALWSGSPEASELPTRPPLRLTQALLQEAFDRERTASLGAELHSLVQPQLAALEAGDLPGILLGPACGHEPFQGLVLSLLGQSQPLPVAQKPALERAARGVAAALLWRREEPGRVLEISSSASLRLNTLDDEACELLPFHQLPLPGEICQLQLPLRIAGRRAKGSAFLAHLLWGADPSARGNATLCALSVPLEGDGEGAVWLALRLRRSAGGRWLRGVVELGCNGGTEQRPLARTSFATDLGTSCVFGGGARRTS